MKKAASLFAWEGGRFARCVGKLGALALLLFHRETKHCQIEKIGSKFSYQESLRSQDETLARGRKKNRRMSLMVEGSDYHAIDILNMRREAGSAAPYNPLVGAIEFKPGNNDVSSYIVFIANYGRRIDWKLKEASNE